MMSALNEWLMLLIVLFVNLVLGLFRLPWALRMSARVRSRSSDLMHRGDATPVLVCANLFAPPGGLLTQRYGGRVSQRSRRSKL